MNVMFVSVMAILFLRVNHETPTSHTQVGPQALPTVTVEKPVIVEKIVTIEKTVDRPVIVEKPVIVERTVEKLIEVEKVVIADPKVKWGSSGVIQEPTDRDACELLAAGYVIEDRYRRQFKLDRRGDMWTRAPLVKEWSRWTTQSTNWATYKYSDVNYPMEYWEEDEATP